MGTRVFAVRARAFFVAVDVLTCTEHLRLQKRCQAHCRHRKRYSSDIAGEVPVNALICRQKNVINVAVILEKYRIYAKIRGYYSFYFKWFLGLSFGWSFERSRVFRSLYTHLEEVSIVFC